MKNILFIVIFGLSCNCFADIYKDLGYSTQYRADIQKLAMYIEISRLEKENRYLGLNEKQKTAQILKDLRLFQQISAHNNAITDETN